MSLLNNYSNRIADYLVCPEGKCPNEKYQKSIRTLFKRAITREDIVLFKDKIVFLFFVECSKEILEELCREAKCVYFVSSSSPENIDSVSYLSSKTYNFYSFLSNQDVDKYLSFVNSFQG